MDEEDRLPEERKQLMRLYQSAPESDKPELAWMIRQRERWGEYFIAALTKRLVRLKNTTVNPEILKALEALINFAQKESNLLKASIGKLHVPNLEDLPQEGERKWRALAEKHFVKSNEEDDLASHHGLMKYVKTGILLGLLAPQLPTAAANATETGTSIAAFTHSAVSNIPPPSGEYIERTKMAASPVLSQIPEITPVPNSPISASEASIDEYIRLGSPKDYQNPRICVFTSYTAHTKERMQASRMVANNQQAYSEKNGYTYLVYEENLAIETDPQTGDDIAFEPYWSKIAGINKILNDQESSVKDKPEWIVWLDDDAIISNPEFRFEDVLHHYTSQQDDLNFIVTTDSLSHIFRSIPLNSAVLFVRNNEWSREFFHKVWEMRNTQVPGNPYTYGSCPNQECLHEQQAITELLLNDLDLAQHARIIPQKDVTDPVAGWGINTFRRESHYDAVRNQKLSYSEDHYRAKAGDFIQQCTGLATSGYTNTDDRNLRNLRFDCIKQVLGETYEAFPPFFSIVSDVETRMAPYRATEFSNNHIHQTLNEQNIPSTEGLTKFKSMIDDINPDSFGLQISKVGIEVTDDKITATYQIPLQRGYAAISLIYDQNSDEITFEGVRRGLSIQIWQAFLSFFANDAQFQAESVDLKDIRPIFKWKITNKDKLSVALKTFGNICKLNDKKLYSYLEDRILDNISRNNFDAKEIMKILDRLNNEESRNFLIRIINMIGRTKNDKEMTDFIISLNNEMTYIDLTSHLIWIHKVNDRNKELTELIFHTLISGLNSEFDNIQFHSLHYANTLSQTIPANLKEKIPFTILNQINRNSITNVNNGFISLNEMLDKNLIKPWEASTILNQCNNKDTYNWREINNRLPYIYSLPNSFKTIIGL